MYALTHTLIGVVRQRGAEGPIQQDGSQLAKPSVCDGSEEGLGKRPVGSRLPKRRVVVVGQGTGGLDQSRVDLGLGQDAFRRASALALRALADLSAIRV